MIYVHVYFAVYCKNWRTTELVLAFYTASLTFHIVSLLSFQTGSMYIPLSGAQASASTRPARPAPGVNTIKTG